MRRALSPMHGGYPMLEYSIWGIPPGEDSETLLCEVVRGERITNKRLADAVKLEAERRGNSSVRIMALNMGGADIGAMFAATVDI